MICRKKIPHPPEALHSLFNSGALECGDKSPLFLFLALVFLVALGCKPKPTDEFARLTNTGKNYYDRGEADKAVAALEQALALNPSHPDAHLNLACACLLANQTEKALLHAEEVLKQDPNSAPALYIAGCASLRLGKAQEALKYLQAA